MPKGRGPPPHAHDAKDQRQNVLNIALAASARNPGLPTATAMATRSIAFQIWNSQEYQNYQLTFLHALKMHPSVSATDLHANCIHRSVRIRTLRLELPTC
jgi:hypothetical protein